MRKPPAHSRSLAALLVGAALVAALGGGAEPDASAATPPIGEEDPAWVWPLAAFRVERPFEAPAHRYGAGHRGIDLRADPAEPIRSPAPGTVAFSGTVARRGILTIDHGDGLVTTLEPVESELEPGAPVDRGQVVARVAVGGHAAPGALHVGVRRHGEYINPLLLLGEVPRAVLLPCC
ncbi:MULTISPECIES: M23 family metallopeptidase [Microbacterium]|uniref:murein hydrolase activator EnvC family protein n=1 Tax=Microbacterium TaxID=33882 RepID=UPI00146F91D3|nr:MULTISPECIES: M23 family metallopeptidase [Microbacterium]